MDIIKICNRVKSTSSNKRGYVRTSIILTLAVLFLTMIKPSEPMAEPSVVCTRTLFNLSFEKAAQDFKDCTVIEGGVHIIDLELPDPWNITTYTRALERVRLPKLREISGYLYLHNSKGLDSLSDLFPNLTVVRGDTLLAGRFAILIWQNEDLKRIGLDIAVLNGSIYIKENYQLCLLENSVKWNKYSPNSKVVIENNMVVNYEGKKVCFYDEVNPPLWPTPPATPCHNSCVGGCVGPSASDCYVCRKFQLKEKCIEECPSEKQLSLYSRRCVDDAECKAHKPPYPTFINSSRNEVYPVFTAYKNTCVQTCPLPYYPFLENGLLKCHNVPNTVCNGRAIATPADAEALQGCIISTDRIEIKVKRCKRYNFTEFQKALEKGLSGIEEIIGGLHISRMNGIQNLHFFKSLKKIHIVKDRYSLFIDDNASLTKLFSPNVTERLQILNGNVVISNNPLLCPSEISNLSRAIKCGGPPLIVNNGRRAQCKDRASSLNATLVHVNATSAVIVLDTGDTDISSIKFSTVFFRPAPGNATYSRLSFNVPSEEQWDTVERVGNITNAFPLTNLRPSTRYAYYAEVVGDENVLQVSKVREFWTPQISAKESPCSVTGWPYPSMMSNESALKIEWAVPYRPSYTGLVEYLIIGEYSKDFAEPCSSPQKSMRLNITGYEADLQDTALKQCSPRDTSVNTRRQIIEKCTPFSDVLDNIVRLTDDRKQSDAFPTHHFEHTLAHIDDKNRTNSNGNLEYFVTVSQTETVVVKNLIPFGEYRIKVYQCASQHNESKANWESRCGFPGFGVGRSSAIESADEWLLKPVALPSTNYSSVILMWEKPKITNSLTWYTVQIISGNTTKQVYCTDKNEIAFPILTDVEYKLCVTIESFVRTGATSCIPYTITESHTWRNFFLVFFSVGVVIIALILIVRKIQRTYSDDRIVLLTEDSFDAHMRFSVLSGDMENVPI